MFLCQKQNDSQPALLCTELRNIEHFPLPPFQEGRVTSFELQTENPVAWKPISVCSSLALFVFAKLRSASTAFTLKWNHDYLRLVTKIIMKVSTTSANV